MKKRFLLSMVVSSFLLTGCGSILPPAFNKIVEEVGVSALDTGFNTMQYIITNGYGDEITNINQQPKNSLNFTLKDDILVSMLVESRGMSLCISAPNKDDYFLDIVNTVAYYLDDATVNRDVLLALQNVSEDVFVFLDKKEKANTVDVATHGELFLLDGDTIKLTIHQNIE